MGTDTTGRAAADGSTGRSAGPRVWLPLLVGVLALLAFPVVFELAHVVLALAGGPGPTRSPSPAAVAVAASVALGVAGVVLGLRALAHHERRWPVWAGTVLSALVACGWTAFALAEAISPT